MIKFILFGASTSLFSSPFISLFKSLFLRENYTDYPAYRSHYSVPQNPFTYSIRFATILNCPNLHIYCGKCLSYLIVTFALCTNLELQKFDSCPLGVLFKSFLFVNFSPRTYCWLFNTIRK